MPKSLLILWSNRTNASDGQEFWFWPPQWKAYIKNSFNGVATHFPSEVRTDFKHNATHKHEQFTQKLNLNTVKYLCAGKETEQNRQRLLAIVTQFKIA